MKKSEIFKYFLSVVTASLLGAFLSFVIFKASSYVLVPAGEVSSADDRSSIGEITRLNTDSISYGKFVPPKLGKIIYVNAPAKIVSEYVDGRIVGSFNILSLNADYPLVTGEYSLLKKENLHRSSRTGLMLPNVVAFAPNYFICGSGTSTPESIGLSPGDSSKVFSFADVNTKIILAGETSIRELTREDRDFLGFSKVATTSVDLKSKIPIRATAYFVKDLDTGEEILRQNENKKLPIASVTKLITAMVALDNLDNNAIVKISQTAVSTDGHQGNLSIGEKFKVVDLVNCLLLESSNDAAEALAEYFGRVAFISLMNGKAKTLGMLDTSFKDPSGLSSKNLSTPEDLSKLTAYVEDNREDILSITKKKSYQVAESLLSKKHIWLNINRLIRDNNSYYLGGKDGFTSDAMMTFAGAFAVPITEFDQKRFSIALLRSSDRSGDIKKIIDKIITSIQYEDGLSLKSVISQRHSKNIQTESEGNLSMMFVGDIMLDRGVKQMINAHGDSSYLFPFEFVPFLKDPDIVFGNLEGPVSDLGYDIGNKYSFRMVPAVIPALKEVGFNVLSIANNHVGDWGMTAFEDTISRLRSSDIAVVGAGLNGQDARSVRIMEKNGIKVGFLGFSDVGPAWLSENDNLPEVLLASDPSFEDIIKESAKRVDYLVVSFHFGEEYKTESNERQRYLAHKAVDAGAKIVIGHHPHVVEELEKYNGGVIAYSLGNFVFDQPFSKETMAGAMLEVILDKGGILQVNQSSVVQNSHFQPILSEESGL